MSTSVQPTQMADMFYVHIANTDGYGHVLHVHIAYTDGGHVLCAHSQHCVGYGAFKTCPPFYYVHIANTDGTDMFYVHIAYTDGGHVLCAHSQHRWWTCFRLCAHSLHRWRTCFRLCAHSLHCVGYVYVKHVQPSVQACVRKTQPTQMCM